MTATEVHTLVAQEIATARDRVLPWFDQPQQVRSWLPANDRWSINEILHHITLTSHYLLLLIGKSSDKCLKIKARGEALIWSDDYTLLPSALQDASKLDAFTWHRPDHMDPRLHPPTADVKTIFLAQMARCEAILDNLKTGWGIMHKTMMSVNDLGKIDVYQYIVFLCMHAQRHCAQMEKNLAAMA